jgi:hypothetical protein
MSLRAVTVRQEAITLDCPATLTIATHYDRILQRYFRGSVLAEGIMSVRTPRPFGLFALVATLLVSAVGVGLPVNTARADHCLAAPNSPAPLGSHWYYRLDWQTQRKCWYFRAPGERAATPATMPPTTPLYSKTIAAPIDKLVQRTAQEGNAAPSVKAPAPQVSTSSQPSVQAAGPASVAPVAWPDALPAVATVKAQEPTAVPTDAPTNSVFDDARRTARGGEPTNNVRMLMIIFSILALGLVMVGNLSRFIIKNAARHRARTIIGRVDDKRQRERGGQNQYGSVDERQALISAVSDSGLSRAESDAFPITYEISKRRFKLAQLRQRLEGLLQLPARPHDEPLQGQTVAY